MVQIITAKPNGSLTKPPAGFCLRRVLLIFEVWSLFAKRHLVF